MGRNSGADPISAQAYVGVTAAVDTVAQGRTKRERSSYQSAGIYGPPRAAKIQKGDVLFTLLDSSALANQVPVLGDVGGMGAEAAFVIGAEDADSANRVKQSISDRMRVSGVAASNFNDKHTGPMQIGGLVTLKLGGSQAGVFPGDKVVADVPDAISVQGNDRAPLVLRRLVATDIVESLQTTIAGLLAKPSQNYIKAEVGDSPLVRAAKADMTARLMTALVGSARLAKDEPDDELNQDDLTKLNANAVALGLSGAGVVPKRQHALLSSIYYSGTAVNYEIGYRGPADLPLGRVAGGAVNLNDGIGRLVNQQINAVPKSLAAMYTAITSETSKIVGTAVTGAGTAAGYVTSVHVLLGIGRA